MASSGASAARICRLEQRLAGRLLEKAPTTVRGARRRRGPSRRRDDEPLDDLLLLEAVARTANVLQRPLGRVRARTSAPPR